MSFAAELPPTPNLSVQLKIAEMQSAGAQHAAPNFNVAGINQGDLVFNDSRWLVTPNDELYRRYAETMDQAGLPYIQNDPSLGSDSVIVGQFPRSARTVAQIIPSRQPTDGGLTTPDVFYLIGSSIHRIEQTTGTTPDPADLHIRRILLLREQAKILLVPTLRLLSYSSEINTETLGTLERQVSTGYAPFGTIALMRSLSRGIDGE